jgi:class 3 adenylate cyclase
VVAPPIVSSARGERKTHGVVSDRPDIPDDPRLIWRRDQRKLTPSKEAIVKGERVERRLAAILAADVVGYSRLMGANEVGSRRMNHVEATTSERTTRRDACRSV